MSTIFDLGGWASRCIKFQHGPPKEPGVLQRTRLRTTSSLCKRGPSKSAQHEGVLHQSDNNLNRPPLFDFGIGKRSILDYITQTARCCKLKVVPKRANFAEAVMNGSSLCCGGKENAPLTTLHCLLCNSMRTPQCFASLLTRIPFKKKSGQRELP